MNKKKAAYTLNFDTSRLDHHRRMNHNAPRGTRYSSQTGKGCGTS